MIGLSFPYVVCHRSMSTEYDPQFQLLQIETCTPELIVKTPIKQEGNFELTSCTYVGHVNLSFANGQATILRITVGVTVQHRKIESVEVSQRYSIAPLEQVMFVRAWCKMSAMNTIIQMIHLPLKCNHREGRRFSGLNQYGLFPHTTNYESWRSLLHLWRRDSLTWHNW